MRRLAPPRRVMTARPFAPARWTASAVPGRLRPPPPHMSPILKPGRKRPSLLTTIILFFFFLFCVPHLMFRPNAVAARGERASFTKASRRRLTQ